VCVSVVCLSARISLEPHARSLPYFLFMLLMAMARFCFCRVTKSQGEGAILVVFFPIDIALYSIAFGMTHTKTTRRDAVWGDKWAWPKGSDDS